MQPAVPRDLETIILKATAKEPSARYATAEDLADDLGRFVDDRPITARRPGPLERSARWARRHAAALVVAVPLLAAACVALGTAFAAVLAKQAEVKRSHAEARRQRDEARRAVNEMYTQVADDWLGKQPGLQPVQRAFLLKALAYYQAFSMERGADPIVRAEAGLAAFRVGEIQRTLGRPSEAEQAYRQAIEVLDEVPEGATRIDVLEHRGESYSGLGQLLAESGRTDEARPVLDRGVELTRTLVSGISGSAEGRPRLARAYHRLGLLLRLAHRDAEAEAAYRTTIELAKTIGGPQGEKLQAGVHGNLGTLLLLSGQRDEAERALREAVRLYESLARRDPSVPVYRQELAQTLRRLGLIAAARPGGLTEAEGWLRRAVELYEPLAAQSPGVPPIREALALALLELADVLTAVGRPHDARPLAERSVMLSEELVSHAPPGSPALRRQLIRRSTAWPSCCRRPARPATPSPSSAAPSRSAMRWPPRTAPSPPTAPRSPRRSSAWPCCWRLGENWRRCARPS